METTRVTTDEKSQGGSRKKRERTCASCREADHPETLIRWVADEEGNVVPDLRGRSFGRGAWIHRRPECLRNIAQALSRSFKIGVKITDREAVTLLNQAGDALVRQLLGAGKRQNLLVFGADMVSESFEEGRARLILLGRDARAAADVSAVSRGISLGLVRVYGDKDRLGALLGRPEVGIVSVEDERLATALFDAIDLALLAPGTDGASPVRKPELIEKAEVE